MGESRTSIWLKERKWWIALLLVIVAGYSVGKDRALQDNRNFASLAVEAR